MRLPADAVFPLALGAAVAVVLSGCAVPRAATASTAASRQSTQAGSAGAPLTSAKSPAQAAVAPGRPAVAVPARPASEQVPVTAQAVTISMGLGSNQGGKVPQKPVTITDPARVTELKTLINDLAPFPKGMFSCPADFGDDLVLTFRAGPATPALAVATVDLSGCDGVALTINGKSQPALAGPGTDNGPLILKTAGLPWQVPAY